MPRVCRRIPKNAVCAVLRACRGTAWLAGRRRSARTMPAAAPPPPPRRTRRACCYLVPVGEAFACADSGRFGMRPCRRRYWQHSVTRCCPWWSGRRRRRAAPRRIWWSLSTPQCAAPSTCRTAQAQSAKSATDEVAGRAAGKGALVFVLGVQVGARDDEPLDDRGTVAERRMHQGGVPKPAHGGAFAAGVSPDRRIPLASDTRSTQPSP